MWFNKKKLKLILLLILNFWNLIFSNNEIYVSREERRERERERERVEVILKSFGLCNESAISCVCALLQQGARIVANISKCQSI